MNDILFGPLLSVANNNEYKLTVVVRNSITRPLTAKINGKAVSESNRITLILGEYIQFSFRIDPISVEQTVTYSIESSNGTLGNQHKLNSWKFEVPAYKVTPRIYTCSCNGEGKEPPEKLKGEQKFMWEKLRKTHEVYPCHLLIMSGDQIYADPLWKMIKKSFKNLDKVIKKKEVLENFQLGTLRKRFKDELCKFYENIYFSAWGHKEIAHMLASTPSLMMWDDHDIFDGFGSHGKEVQESELVKCIYEVASYYFKLFQSRPANNNSYLDSSLIHFGQHISYRNYEIFVLDGRAERNENQVCSNNQYKQLQAKLSGTLFQNHPYTDDSNPKILCLVISVPVAHFHYTKFVFSLSKIVSGGDFRNDSKDDTLDQWSHKNHRDEQRKLLDIITKGANDNNVKYAYIISGDVHSAGAAQAYGINKIKDAQGNLFHPYIAQIVASPIVHKSHGLFQKLFLRTLSRSKMVIKGCMIQFKHFGGINKQTIHKRNFIVLHKRVKGSEGQRASGLKAFLYTKKIPKDGNKNHGYMLPFFKQKDIID